MSMYKPYRSTAEMEKELTKWSPSWGNQISTRAILYACHKLDEIAQLLREKPKRAKRKPSAYNKFFSAGIKAGKTFQQIGSEWRQKKAR